MFKELFTEGIDAFSREMEADAKRAGLDMSHTSPESATFYFDTSEVSVVVRDKKYKIKKNKASSKEIKKIKEFLGDWDVVTEGKLDYEIYHNTYTSAINAAERFAQAQGYTLDPEEMADKVGLGPGKPKSGKTTKHTIDLYKNGKMISNKFKLQIQVYNRGTNTNTYELNVYLA